MLCKECEYFEIVREPYRNGGIFLDWGLARCEKHDLVTDFRSYSKFDWLECVEGDASGGMATDTDRAV